MLTHYRKPVCLSLSSADLPFWSGLETMATLYQKDCDRYHLVLTEPVVDEAITSIASHSIATTTSTSTDVPTPRLLWLEFSPYRVTMTMQGNGRFSYRHLFEPNVFGTSHYWLRDEDLGTNGQFRLRNFTRNLHVKGSPLPCYMLLEYELWAGSLSLGQYTLNLEIHH